eukprot:6195858-Pleurochrysis_carterae.AAC.1
MVPVPLSESSLRTRQQMRSGACGLAAPPQQPRRRCCHRCQRRCQRRRLCCFRNCRAIFDISSLHTFIPLLIVVMTVLPAVNISPAGTPLCGQQVQGLGPAGAAGNTDGEEAKSAAGIASKLDVFLWSAQPTLESQHAIMSAAMVNARRARLRAEADRQLLANR